MACSLSEWEDAVMSVSEALEVTRVGLSLALLAVSSYCDYKTRRVPNLVFKVFMPAAAVLTLVDIFLAANFQTRLITFGAYTAIAFAIFYAVGYVGLFGGADAKILMGLSLAVPWPLVAIRPVLGTEFPILSVSVFNNTLFFAVAALPYALVSNIVWKVRTGLSLFGGLEEESLVKRVGVVLFCVKKERSKVRPYDLIAERSGKLTLFNRVQEEDLSPEELRSLPENVFVTFSLPLVVFIAVGFVATIFIGDLIIFLVKGMFGF